MSISSDGIAYRRRLPHWYPPGATFFITFGLAGAVPRYRVDTLADKGARAPDGPLDQPSSWERNWEDGQRPHWLTDSRIAPLVVESLCYRDGKAYDLEAYCVMPSHVHMVCTPLPGADGNTVNLATILQSLKTRTARQANLVLARTGTFWHEESYDHVVRDPAELERIVIYILNNPVKGGLVRDWREWPWSWARHLGRD